jgi:hypothetical protein
VHKWRCHTFPSPGPNFADSGDEGGTSDDGGAANRLGRIGWCGNSGRWRRLDLRANLRVDVRSVDFRTVDAGANRSGHNSAWYYATWHNAARYNAARYNAAGNGRTNTGYRSSDTWNRDSGNHPKHHHDADSADNTRHHHAADHSQHAGNDAFDAEHQSKFSGSRINQSSEQHSPDYNATNNA